MLIGIDASRAFVANPTGTETYSYQVITHMLRLPTAKKHTFVLFIRPNIVVPQEIVGYNNVIVKEIKLPYLWTQVGLARATWKGQVTQYRSESGLAVTVELENCKTGKLDVLWIPAHTLPVWRNPKVKTVVTIHGLEYRWLPEYRNWLQRWYLPLSTFYAARAADRLIAVSEATKRDLLQEIQIDPQKINVILEGATIGTPASQRISKSASQFVGVPEKVGEKYGIQWGKYGLFVGTIQPRKNLTSLIQAWKQAELPRDYRLVIAGARGWISEVVLREPERLGIPDQVVFTGRINQTELTILYRGAKFYVQPSWTEGFGLPVLEAMAYSVPVIISDGGALPEVAGKAGLVVPHGRDFVGRLARAIERVSRDDGLRKKLVKAGEGRIKQLTWQQTAKKTLSLLARMQD